MRVVVLMEICGGRALFVYVFRCTGLLTGVTELTYCVVVWKWSEKLCRRGFWSVECRHLNVQQCDEKRQWLCVAAQVYTSAAAPGQRLKRTIFSINVEDHVFPVGNASVFPPAVSPAASGSSNLAPSNSRGTHISLSLIHI